MTLRAYHERAKTWQKRLGAYTQFNYIAIDCYFVTFANKSFRDLFLPQMEKDLCLMPEDENSAREHGEWAYLEYAFFYGHQELHSKIVNKFGWDLRTRKHVKRWFAENMPEVLHERNY